MLQYLETNVILPYIADAWQNHLETESDPASGKWFRNGPNNGPGLFGGLTDTLRTDLVFSQDPDAMNINKGRSIAVSTTLDNRRGLLNDSPATQTLQWTMTNSSTTSHSTSNSIKTGIVEKLKFVGKLPSGIGIESETTVSVEYQYSWTDGTANTVTDTKTLTSTIPLKVPQNKAYKLLVLADTLDIVIPYSAQIYLSGRSEANFSRSINGKSNWSTDAGTLCHWIDQFGAAKGDAMQFDVDPSNKGRGIAFISGSMKSSQSFNFTIFAIDVTDTLDSDPKAAKITNAIKSGDSPEQVVMSGPANAKVSVA